jgi:hypothetical protein
VAGYSLWIIMATALLSLVGLIKLSRKSLFQFVKIPVLFLSIVASALMAYTAHLGGQVRHPEVLSSFTPGNPEEDPEGNETDTKNSDLNNEELAKEDEKDDD